MRKAVREFANEMERVLEENDHKGGWIGEDVQWLFDMLIEETQELQKFVDQYHDSITPIDDKYKKKIRKECVDVANFAMMIFDNLSED